MSVGLPPPPAHAPRVGAVPDAMDGARVGADGRVITDEATRTASLRRVDAAIAAAGVGIPPATGPAGDLPAGIHAARWGEFETRYATNPRRADLASQLRRSLDVLHHAGIQQVVVGGSYIGAKAAPGDVDVAWIRPAGAPLPSASATKRELGRVASDVHVYLADQVVSNAPTLPGARAGENFMELFQHDRSGTARGAVLLATAPAGPEVGSAPAVRRSAGRSVLEAARLLARA